MLSKFVEALINFLSAPPKYFEQPKPSNYHPLITPKYGNALADVIFHSSAFMKIITPIPQALDSQCRTASLSVKHRERESIPLARLVKTNTR